MSERFRIGLLGHGTVGGAFAELLPSRAAHVEAITGMRPEIVGVLTRSQGSFEQLLEGSDLIVEVIGGIDPARDYVLRAMRAGKHVVTANKQLLSQHGEELWAAAREHAVQLRYEAAVAGVVPVIRVLNESLGAAHIDRIHGIVNGTTNFILTEMARSGRSYEEALAEAQRLGYAEADPSFDIDGVDAAHKLAILAALAFGRPVDLGAVHVEGIREVSALDIALAEELGYRIKLLGIAKREEAGISTRVHPCMVPANAPIARVDGVFNAVVAEGDFAGRIVMEGRGAGAGPTASAVVADLIDLARGRHTPVWGASNGALDATPAVPMEHHVGAYYLRLMVVDRPGVIADVTGVLRDHAISLESMLQRGRAPGEAVPVVLTTHDCEEAAMRAALARIAALDAVLEKPALIRVEPL